MTEILGLNGTTYSSRVRTGLVMSGRSRNRASLRPILSLKFNRVGLYFLARFTFPKGTLAHSKLLWAFFKSISRFKYTDSNSVNVLLFAGQVASTSELNDTNV